jgi:hypothetical protein
MKQAQWIILSIFLTLTSVLAGQTKKDSCCLSKKDLVGLWQRNNEIVGSGLLENFEFFENDTFVLNLGDMSEDARSIVKLKGKYRLVKDKLYFTITSKTVLEGPIELTDGGISLNLFSITNGKLKEAPELNPKEQTDPCYITLFSSKHIKLNNEVYFKVKLQ